MGQERLRCMLVKAGFHNDVTLQMGQSLICGSMAGLLSSTLTFPLDLVRRRMQLEGRRGAQIKYDSYASVVRAVYRRQGLLGFYQGILPEYYKVGTPPPPLPPGSPDHSACKIFSMHIKYCEVGLVSIFRSDLP